MANTTPDTTQDIPDYIPTPSNNVGRLTAREIIQNYKNLYNGGKSTDEVAMSDRQWLFNLNHHRAQLLRQSYEKGQSINEENLQELGELGEDGTRTLNIRKQKCGRWYITPIPDSVEVYQGNLITFVGTPSGREFQKTTAQKAYWDKEATFTGRLPKWYQQGSSLFITSPPSAGMNVITVRGIWGNPRAVMAYNNEVLDPIDYLNFPYPINRSMLDTIYSLITAGELKLLGLPNDPVNDGQEPEQKTHA